MLRLHAGLVRSIVGVRFCSASFTQPNDPNNAAADADSQHLATQDTPDDAPLYPGMPEESLTFDDKDPKVIHPKRVHYVNPVEGAAIEFQKFVYDKEQFGPWIESENKKELQKTDASMRSRRTTTRVPPINPVWVGHETSFRRIPKDVVLPNEYELRARYPKKTMLPIEYGYANCVHFNATDMFEDPQGVKYGRLLPKDYDPARTYPVMVVLGDHSGNEVDFEDICANFFERENFYAGWQEQQWVILAPVVNMRWSSLIPVEGVVAHFCDWAAKAYNCEGGKVHLFGKGYGGFTALRACVEYKSLAISVTAILGRQSSPYRPMDSPMEKSKNIHGTHVLMYVPGAMLKTEYAYKFKGMLDFNHVRPPCRCIHFADVRDHQIYYCINPIEFWNYMQFFRDNNMLDTMTESGHLLPKQDESFIASDDRLLPARPPEVTSGVMPDKAPSPDYR